MNKSALKNFAVDSRKELIEKIQIKAMQYGIEKDKIKNSQIQSSDSIVINGNPLSKDEKHQREKLIEKIRSINNECRDGYKDVIEEVAYTWFNRFTALRFMEINNYLPTRVRALSSSTPGSIEPELIKEASNVDLPVDKQKIYEMKLNNDTEGLFKYMIIIQCNALNISLSFMFEKIGHYTELLFPDGLLNKGAFIRRLTDIESIPESDWEDVEIIGWLYQYYNSEEKDRVIKAKKKYKKGEIPFATQLFTPDWIVRYMVQNTLGKYWVESHPEHSNLKKNWEFYLENRNPEPDFEEKLKPYINKELKVEDIKCFDPAMGSGHILVYMFDVLYQIYEKCGYMSREIPKLIIENNLYGLEIDDRAYELACFAVIMKGMKYNNRLLRNIEREAGITSGEGIKLNLASIQETNAINNDDIIYISGESSGENYNKTKAFIELFRNAKLYGSLINVEKFDEGFFNKRVDYIINNPSDNIFQEESRRRIIDLLPILIRQTSILEKTYDVLVTNPPYMGSRYMNTKLSDFIKDNYNYSSDLFSVFIEHSKMKVRANGQLGFITPFVWMFISAYEDLRKDIISNNSITSLVELEYNSFEVAVVPVCTFTIRNYNVDLYGEYIKLSGFTGSENQPIKTLEAISNSNSNYRYQCKNIYFTRIPGNPIGYWIPKELFNIFDKEQRLIEFIDATGSQNITADNEKYLRFLWEIKKDDINKKWALYTKGGKYRKWYGNLEYVVNWSDEARHFYKTNKSSNLLNEKYWFRDGLTYNGISNRGFTVRTCSNTIYDKKGPTFHILDKKNEKYLLGLLNTKVIDNIMNLFNPTMSYQKRDVDNLPIVFADNDTFNKVEELAKECVRISKYDWDSIETSLDFKLNPVIEYKKDFTTIKESISYYIDLTKENFDRLKQNEKQLNNIFIKLYGLENFINNQVDDDVTVSVSTEKSCVEEFISYAVGCKFGRYSLDQEGLIYAGGNFDYSKYKSIPVDEDNIIPILSESYFEDDIVSKFVEFIKITFGEETLSENLEYIAETLGRKGSETAKETIRRYFINNFYKDHLQTYKNRPIYWMFTSGKQKAFNCLIYMHRYDKTTLSRIRTDYLHELQDRLGTERKSLVDVIEGDYSTKEKSQSEKKLTSLNKQIDELKKYDELLHHMADMQIEIDLDDGVKVNYGKFKGLVAKI